MKKIRTVLPTLAPFSIFAGVLWVLWLVRGVFPYAAIAGDTMTYYEATENFHVFGFNFSDWSRTPPFGLLLHVLVRMPHPDAAFFWLNGGLFVLVFLLVYMVAAWLFRSGFRAWLLTVCLFLVEMAIIQPLLYAAAIMSDVLYAQLLLVGCLLALIGWLKRRTGVLCIGYAALGIACFTRPVGLSLLPLLMLFAVITTIATQEGIGPKRRRILCLWLLFFLFAPTFAWSAHNAVLYGQFKTTAYAAPNLLPRVLPLLKDTDTVLRDPEQNKAFIASVRATERVFGREYNDYAWAGNTAAPGVLPYLRTLTETYARTAGNPMGKDWTLAYFETDTIGMKAATAIILQHPLAYLHMVARDYAGLFPSPISWTALRTGESLTQRASSQYASVMQSYPKSTLRLLYPPGGALDATRISSSRAQTFASLASFPGHALIATIFLSKVGCVLAHLLFLFCIVFLLFRRRLAAFVVPPQRSVELAVVSCFLFLAAASQYLLTSAVELPLERYALPGGIAWHLSVLLGITLVCRIAWAAVRTKVLVKASDAEKGVHS